MNLHIKIKRLLLAGIIALALLLGTIGVAHKLQTGNNMQLAIKGGVPATPNGACWKCNEG
jgi:hypothetical protein